MTDTVATTASPETTPSPDPAATEAFAERLFGSFIAGLEVLSLQAGAELGLYRALDESGWCTSADLAAAAGIHERYAREWLEQQAVAGFLAVDDAAAEAGRRRYRMPAAHREVLVDEESPNYLAAGAFLVSAIAEVMPRVLAAFRTGGGVGYAEYGRRLAHGIAALNGPAYRAELGGTWLPGIPEIDAALRRPGARVLDVGCGHGVTSIEIARAYPRASVVGVDLDRDSVAQARTAASAAGVADRVTFTLADAGRLDLAEQFDVVTIFEALHDMGDPAGALRNARAALRNRDGRVLVGDERVAETFTAPGDEIERFCYGASVLHCLPATMAESPVEASGTALRPATVARWAREAGYAGVQELPIESVFWRFYLLTP